MCPEQNLLAIETATDACSLALCRAGELRVRHEVAPRRHSARLLALLGELTDGCKPADLGLDAIVYGSGPGSFTGLRIAASAAQGLAYSLQLPVIGISTLAAQVLSACRDTEVARVLRAAREGGARHALVLSTLDAHIGELYWALYRLALGSADALPEPVLPPAVCAPAQLDRAAIASTVQPDAPLLLIGSGAPLLDAAGAPGSTGRGWGREPALVCPGVLPEARDLLPLAAAALRRGDVQQPAQVAPLYVRRPTEWKTLEQQGSPL